MNLFFIEQGELVVLGDVRLTEILAESPQSKRSKCHVFSIVVTLFCRLEGYLNMKRGTKK